MIVFNNCEKYEEIMNFVSQNHKEKVNPRLVTIVTDTNIFCQISNFTLMYGSDLTCILRFKKSN